MIVSTINEPKAESPLGTEKHWSEIQILKQRIKDLEEQLLVAQNRVPCPVCSARASPLILRLPTEILTMIFESHGDTQRRRNSNLMQVCKRWYQLVLRNPTFWNDIVLELEYVEDLPNLWKYADYCLRQSKPSPLSIVLDASRFEPSEECFIPASRASKNIIERSYGNLYQSSIIPDQRLGRFNHAMLSTIAILRGENDEPMFRWKKLCIKVDRVLCAETRVALWNGVNAATPNLAFLEFKTIGDPWENIDDATLTGFPDLSALKGFATTENMSFDRTFLPVSDLRRLLLGDLDSATHFLKLAGSRFRSLLVLELYTWVEDYPEWKTALLPSLEVLALAGNGHHLILELLEAPKVTHLSLHRCNLSLYPHCSIISTITDLLLERIHPYEYEKGFESLVVAQSRLERIHVVDGGTRASGICRALLHGCDKPTLYIEGAAGWPYHIPDFG